jgi:hypothetical protein
MVLELPTAARRFQHALASLVDWQLASLAGKDVVIVYQMGKVASHTVLRALQRAAPDRLALFHVHFMMPDQIDYWWRQAEQAFGGSARIPSSIWRSVATARVLSRRLRHPSSRRCRIVTLTRDPVARNVSAFFTMQPWWPPGLAEQCRVLAAGPQRGSDLVAAVRDAFFRAFPFHDLPLTWFSTDLGPFANVDPFATPFPHERGYQIVRTGSADVLVLRTEDLARCARPALAEFLGIDVGSLARENDACNAWYHPAYEALRSALRPPDQYLDRMYESTYARHFYSEAERTVFRRRWAARGETRHGAS